MSTSIRVRFAPSPTGFMHLGSVRIALLNYIFARQKQGTFILRIEDTDASRNLDQAKARIVQDLAWLGLTYDEGPGKGGPYGPYSQSERNDIYQKHLQELGASCKIYRCFCTAEQLETKRQKQQAMGKPPRYDRTCLGLSDDKIKSKLAAAMPFVWRFKLNQDQIIQIQDLARGTITFELKHFSDFAITRADGTCTFMFVNFIDDWLMNISHVIRGEDHLTNTALQAALYDAFAVKQPLFWHLQIICNAAGEKLSKRDFGFSLEDLKDAGYLPEAINNYMTTVGASFAQEVQSLPELVKSYNFSNIHTTGAIRYDVDKLTWFNHKWVDRISPSELFVHAKPFLHEAYPQSASLSDQTASDLLQRVKSDIKTFKDIKPALHFYFETPDVELAALAKAFGDDHCGIITHIFKENSNGLDNGDVFLQAIKDAGKAKEINTKIMFSSLRYLLTGRFEGVGMHELLSILGTAECKKRLERALK